jgi:hypothetical protein
MITLCDLKSNSSAIRNVILGIFRFANPEILSFTIIELRPPEAVNLSRCIFDKNHHIRISKKETKLKKKKVKFLSWRYLLV